MKSTTAKTTLNDRMLETFTGVDGKTHNIKWLATQAVELGKKEGSFAENLFIVAKGKTQAEFDAFDKDVRAGMKWGKAPTKADEATKALYGATPRAWKNIVSIINQSYTHKIDLKHYDDVYGKNGINAELKARKDASGSKGTGLTTEGAKAVKELSPAMQGFIMHVSALNEAIMAQPDHATMMELCMVELTDALDRCEALLQAGIDTVGEVDLDKEIAKELAKTTKEGSKAQAQAKA